MITIDIFEGCGGIVTDISEREKLHKKISVIVPVYNVRDYLARFLKSVQYQTFDMNKAEVILVDDGSNDAPEQVIETFTNKIPNITLIHKQNGGAASARNAGLEVANGDYVSFLDPDDYIEPHYLEKAYNEALRTAADIVIFDAYREDEAKGRTLWNHSDIMFVTNNPDDIASMQCQIIYPYMNAHAGDIRLKRNIPLSAPWDKLYKRDFLISNNLHFPGELRVLDDMCFNYVAFGKATKIAYIPVPLYHYVIQKGTITNSYKANRAELDIKAFGFLEKEIGDAERNKEYSRKSSTNIEQAYYARIIKSFAICCNLSFFNKKSPLNNRQQLVNVKDYMSSEPYSIAFHNIKLRNLEWKLKLVVITARLNSPRMIRTLHVLQRAIT